MPLMVCSLADETFLHHTVVTQVTKAMRRQNTAKHFLVVASVSSVPLVHTNPTVPGTPPPAVRIFHLGELPYDLDVPSNSASPEWFWRLLP